jgi:glycosyltransferase involved in cell wall biosynthesis
MRILPDSLSQQALKADRAAIWILYLARVHPVKGQLHAIDVWESLAPQDRSRCFMLFVGPEAHSGALHDLKGRIAGSKDNSRVFIVGSTHNPSQWLDSADIFLSCSEFEGLPLAPLEAICRGVNAICSDIPGHRFLKDHAKLFNLQHPEDAAAEIHRAVNQLKDGDLRQISRAGFDWVKTNYSVTQMMDRYKELYGRV